MMTGDAFHALRAKIRVMRQHWLTQGKPLSPLYAKDWDDLDQRTDTAERQVHEGITHLQKRHEEELQGARRDTRGEAVPNPPQPSLGDTSALQRKNTALGLALQWTRERDEHCDNCVVPNCSRCVYLRWETTRLRCLALGTETNDPPVAPVSPEAPRTEHYAEKEDRPRVSESHLDAGRNPGGLPSVRGSDQGRAHRPAAPDNPEVGLAPLVSEAQRTDITKGYVPRIKAGRRISTDEFYLHLGAELRRQVQGTESAMLTRAEALRVANDVLELAVGPEAPTLGPWCAPDNRVNNPALEGCTGEGRPSCTATECFYGIETCPICGRGKGTGMECGFVHIERDILKAHHTKIIEAAHRLFKRFGKDDADVMELWSLVVIDPRPITDADVKHAHELFPQYLIDHDAATCRYCSPQPSAPAFLASEVVTLRAAITRLTAENEQLKADVNARYEWVAALAAPRAPDGETK